jgi:type I restriction enzyme S subunit
MRKDADVKYIRITDFDDFGIAAGTSFVTAEVIRSDFLLHNEDVLFARSGATAGKSFIYAEDIGPAIFAGYCIRFVFDRARVLPWYVYFYTKTRAYGAWVRAVQRPSGQPNINKEEFKSLRIPVPPIVTQERLASAMQAARKSRSRKVAEVEALLKGTDRFVLRELGLETGKQDYPRTYGVRLSAAWIRCDADFHSPRFRELRERIETGVCTAASIGQLCREIKSGFAAGREVQAFDEVAGVPHIRPLNISPYGELTFDGTKYVPRSAVGPNELISRHEVLFNNTNSTEWVGKSSVFEADRACCCSNHISRLVVNEVVADAWYVAAILNALRSTGYLGLLATNFVNQAGINTPTLSALRVPLPDMSRQKQIAEEISRRREQATHLRAEAEREWEEAKTWFEQQLLAKDQANPPRE